MHFEGVMKTDLFLTSKMYKCRITLQKLKYESVRF